MKRSASRISRQLSLASTVFALVNICAHHSSADAASASARFEDLGSRRAGETLAELRVGQAGHAFDHLGNIGAQAEAAAASGATIIYATGIGALGYQGMPSPEELRQQRESAAAYNRAAKRCGIRLALGYVCATSIVKLEAFERNWTPEFRAQFRTPPSDWRQQDRNGNSLPSWYGGDYQPACMNNPDWRAYEHFVVRQQIESGHDGIFFDNPTVHPQGCYCAHCMEKFAQFLKREKVAALPVANSLSGLREVATVRSNDFLRFRCTIARDFLADMRSYARGFKGAALITANNSLNSADVLFSQCRAYGYNIYEMSQAEDLVVVEDMSSLPRVLPDGRVIEYGPTYQQLHAVAHGRPVVAVSLAEADYHTPPNLVRLALAEAAANGASHLWWPTWPEQQRERMAGAIRPQVAFLRQNAKLLNDAIPRRDVVLYLPFRRWIETSKCVPSQLAAALTRANVQYEVICEDDLRSGTKPGAKVFVVESASVLNTEERKALEKFRNEGGRVITADKPEWMETVKTAVGTPSLSLTGPPTLRATVRDQSRRTIVHLLNLNVQRLSSFEDKVTPAEGVRLTVRVPFKKVRSVRALTADADATAGLVEFAATRAGDASLVQVTLPRLEIATLLVIER